MEENVALDTSRQKQFVKSIKGIKKLIKKAGEEVPEPTVPKPQTEKKPKKKRPDRGLVYLSHIPHGFYEHEMTQYFSQFGAVSNVRVIRSKRTGNSKGFAFVEFKQPAVAEIVAETMNNYLMGKRLIKAAYVPPEKQKPKAMRKHWSRLNNPGRTERLKQKKAHNENKDLAGELARARKTFSLFNKNKKKLADLGINYDFFTPVDIPEELMENKDSQKTVKDNTSKKIKDGVQTKDSKVQKKDETKKSVPKKEVVVKVEKKKVELKKVPEPVVSKKEQKQKQQKLKDSGVKPPENFIKVQEDDDSDSSADFDSDDYNKMMENESDVESGDESDDEVEQGSGDEFEVTGSEDDDSEVDESEVEQVLPPKKSKGKLGPIAPLAPVPSKQKPKMQEVKATRRMRSKSIEERQATRSKSTEQKIPLPKQIQKVSLQQEPKVSQMGKRKTSQKNAVSPKKPKFEKQTQQPMKKQFKKKK